MKLLYVLGLLGLIGCASVEGRNNKKCIRPYAQCGGKNFKGIKRCTKGFVCVEQSELLSTCVPAEEKPSTTEKPNPLEQWPTAQKRVILNEPMIIKAGTTFDGLAENGVWTSYGRDVYADNCVGIEGGSEDAVFRIETGATLKNVILGPDSIEHVHCIGDSCRVENVWWDDICEDALSINGATNPEAHYYLIGGGARRGHDKIVQHNSAGTVHISNFDARDSKKLYRTCGNCKKGYYGERHAIIENVVATNMTVIAGVNINYNDSVVIKNVQPNGAMVCQRYIGNHEGKEPIEQEPKCEGATECLCN